MPHCVCGLYLKHVFPEHLRPNLRQISGYHPSPTLPTENAFEEIVEDLRVRLVRTLCSLLKVHLVASPRQSRRSPKRQPLSHFLVFVYRYCKRDDSLGVLLHIASSQSAGALCSRPRGDTASARRKDSEKIEVFQGHWVVPCCHNMLHGLLDSQGVLFRIAVIHLWWLHLWLSDVWADDVVIFS